MDLSSVYVSVSLVSLWIRAYTQSSMNPLNCNSLQRPCFQIRSHSEIEGEESGLGERWLMDVNRTFQKEPVMETEKQQSWESEGYRRGWSHRAYS